MFCSDRCFSCFNFVFAALQIRIGKESIHTGSKVELCRLRIMLWSFILGSFICTKSDDLEVFTFVDQDDCVKLDVLSMVHASYFTTSTIESELKALSLGYRGRGLPNSSTARVLVIRLRMKRAVLLHDLIKIKFKTTSIHR